MSELAYDQPMKVNREGQIPRELERQLHGLEALHQTIELLEERTSTIRSPHPPPGSPDSRPEALRADVAQLIAERADAIENATRRIRQIIDELEL